MVLRFIHQLRQKGFVAMCGFHSCRFVWCGINGGHGRLKKRNVSIIWSMKSSNIKIPNCNKIWSFRKLHKNSMTFVFYHQAGSDAPDLMEKGRSGIKARRLQNGKIRQKPVKTESPGSLLPELPPSSVTNPVFGVENISVKWCLWCWNSASPFDSRGDFGGRRINSAKTAVRTRVRNCE